MANDNKWKTVGSVRKNDKGNFYVKITEGVTFKKDDVVQLQDPRKKIDSLVERGYITNDEGNQRKAKIPDYIKYDVVVPPNNK